MFGHCTHNASEINGVCAEINKTKRSMGSDSIDINWTKAAEGAGAFGTKLTAGAFAGKVLAHGMVGGVMSKLQGGKFGNEIKGSEPFI